MSTRSYDDAVEERGAEEPCREYEPDGGEGEIFDQAGGRLYLGGTSEPGEEESGCGPCPYFLDKVDVEDVGFGGKVVGVA